MYSDLQMEEPPLGMTRALAFTLATAMVWLDHDCQGGCPPQAATLTASVWYAKHPATTGDDEINTTVVVRFRSSFSASSSAPEAGLLERVNSCARGDGIRVQERRSAIWDDPFAVLADRSAEHSLPLPVCVA